MPDASSEPPITASRRFVNSHLASTAFSQKAPDSGAAPQTGEQPPSPPGGSAITPGARAAAEGLIRDIGIEFNKLRRKGRSAAWADLEDRVAAGGQLLVTTGMLTPKDWIGMMIDIEQFRKSEGGSEELPGDALAKWLSEPEKKLRAKRGSKVSPILPPPLPEPVPDDDDDDEVTV